MPKWSKAFRDTITERTGATVFAYRIAVTRLQGDGDVDRWSREWSQDPTIKANLDGCSFGFLTLEEMWGTLLVELKKTPASSEIGRLARAAQGSWDDGSDRGGAARTAAA